MARLLRVLAGCGRAVGRAVPERLFDSVWYSEAVHKSWRAILIVMLSLVYRLVASDRPLQDDPTPRLTILLGEQLAAVPPADQSFRQSCLCPQCGSSLRWPVLVRTNTTALGRLDWHDGCHCPRSPEQQTFENLLANARKYIFGHMACHRCSGRQTGQDSGRGLELPISRL